MVLYVIIMKKTVKLFVVLRMVLFESISFFIIKLQTWLVSLAAKQLRYLECE